MPKGQILFIEDNDSVREVVTRQLEALGMIVTALPDGDRVKQELSKTVYDLVIADLHLPDCSGFDIARFANAKNCKIILLSGDAHAATRGDSLTAQFDEIWMKPVTLQNLKQLLERHHLVTEEPKDAANSNSLSLEDISGAIDIRVLEEQMGYLDDAALDMLGRFPNMMRPLVQQIQQSRNAADIFEIAHSLKGAARSAGAMRLGSVAELIQNEAGSGTIEPTSLQSLFDEFQKAETAIEMLCGHKEAAL